MMILSANELAKSHGSLCRRLTQRGDSSTTDWQVEVIGMSLLKPQLENITFHNFNALKEIYRRRRNLLVWAVGCIVN